MLTDPRPAGSSHRRAAGAWRFLAAFVTVFGVSMLLAGPGTDLDVANIFRSGRSIVLHGGYTPSRAPGAFLHELAVGVFDRVGGPIATNLVSVLSAIVLVVALDRLLAFEGIGRGRRVALAVLVANPWFLIAATSTVDFVPALMFTVLAALALRRGHPVWAGVAAGAAIGCRIGSALLIASLLVAELTDRRSTGAPPSADDHADGDEPDTVSAPSVSARDRTGSGRLRTVLLTGATTSAVTVLLFIPSYLHAGGLAFAENDFTSRGLLVHLGRAGAKNLMLFGPVATVVLLAALPTLLRTIRTWHTSWLVRFAVPAIVLSELLFLRFPWKMGHLLPIVVFGVILLAVTLVDRPRLLVLLVVLQLVYGLVSLEVIRPDDPNWASGGRPTLAVGWGPLIVEQGCRRDHPDPHLGRQKVEVETIWNCAQPFHR